MGCTSPLIRCTNNLGCYYFSIEVSNQGEGTFGFDMTMNPMGLRVVLNCGIIIRGLIFFDNTFLTECYKGGRGSKSPLKPDPTPTPSPAPPIQVVYTCNHPTLQLAHHTCTTPPNAMHRCHAPSPSTAQLACQTKPQFDPTQHTGIRTR